VETEVDGQGNLAALSLTIPAGTATALAILDVFPFYEEASSE